MSSRLSLAIVVLGVVISVGSPAGTGRGNAAPPVNPLAKDNPAGKEKPPAPMVYFGVMEDYTSKELTKLKYPVDSALEMATEFDRIGYQVRFATDSGSVGRVKKRLKEPTVIRECNTGDELTADIKLWLRAVAAARPPIAVLVLAGHGEERVISTDRDKPGRKVAFLLTRDDVSGTGGVSIDALSEAAAEQGGVPIVIVSDACRTPASRCITSPGAATFTVGRADSMTVTTEFTDPVRGKLKPSLKVDGILPQGVQFKDNGDGTATLAGTPAEKTAGTFPVTVTATAGPKVATQVFTLTVGTRPVSGAAGVPTIRTNALRSPNDHPYPTVLYSTQSGKGASDQDCLVRGLTAGLKYDANVKQFLLWHAPETVKEPTAEVTLYHWFCYGVAQLARAHGLEQSHEIVTGAGAPLTTSVYRVLNGKLQAPLKSAAERDLLDVFQQVRGKLKVAYDPRDGLTVTRPVGVVDEGYASSALGKPTGYPAAGMSLVMDVVATTDAKALPTKFGKLATLEVLMSNYDGTRTVSLGLNSRHPVMFHHLSRVTFPLLSVPNPATKEPYPMNELAVIAGIKAAGAAPPVIDPWPEGVTFKIAELKLIPQPPKQNPKTGEPPITCNQLGQDVLPRWFVGQKDAHLTIKHGDARHKYVEVSAAGEKGGRVGGDLYPRLYVTPSNELEVEATNGGKAVAQLSVDLMYRDPKSGDHYPVANSGTWKLGAGEAMRKSVPLAGFGYANYLAVNVVGTEVRLGKMSIKTKTK